MVQEPRVITPVPASERFQGFYSNMSSGSQGPESLWVQKFKMESIRSVVASLSQGNVLVISKMPTCTFRFVPSTNVSPCFAVGESHYQFVALPFSLASAPPKQGSGPSSDVAATAGDCPDWLPGYLPSTCRVLHIRR